LSKDFKQLVATEIEEFKAGRNIVADEDLLREVMNTVG